MVTQYHKMRRNWVVGFLILAYCLQIRAIVLKEIGFKLNYDHCAFELAALALYNFSSISAKVV